MIQTIAVLGAGTMGHGIAHTFSRHGYQVNLYEPFDAVRESAPPEDPGGAPVHGGRGIYH